MPPCWTAVCLQQHFCLGTEALCTPQPSPACGGRVSLHSPAQVTGAESPCTVQPSSWVPRLHVQPSTAQVVGAEAPCTVRPRSWLLRLHAHLSPAHPGRGCRASMCSLALSRSWVPRLRVHTSAQPRLWAPRLSSPGLGGSCDASHGGAGRHWGSVDHRAATHEPCEGHSWPIVPRVK